MWAPRPLCSEAPGQKHSGWLHAPLSRWLSKGPREPTKGTYKLLGLRAGRLGGASPRCRGSMLVVELLAATAPLRVVGRYARCLLRTLPGEAWRTIADFNLCWSPSPTCAGHLCELSFAPAHPHPSPAQPATTTPCVPQCGPCWVCFWPWAPGVQPQSRLQVGRGVQLSGCCTVDTRACRATEACTGIFCKEWDVRAREDCARSLCRAAGADWLSRRHEARGRLRTG
jgi:hypothetical protein